MADIQISNSNKSKVGVKRLNKKATKVDLTPMVDLGFLLITFFVFTTTMSMTTAMDINQTKEGEPTNVPSSGATTILLGKNNNLFYYFGDFETAKTTSKIYKTNYTDIRKVIIEKNKNTKVEKLMYIIKSDDESTFGNVIAITDELHICGVKPGHYAEDKMSEDEKGILL